MVEPAPCPAADTVGPMHDERLAAMQMIHILTRGMALTLWRGAGR